MVRSPPLLARVLFAACLALAAACARAELRVTVDATDPASPAVLVRHQSLFVRIVYAGAQEHQFWVRPYFQGRPVNGATRNASLRYTGSGVALGHFSLTQAGAVDEIRIVAGGGLPYREIEVHGMPVDFRGTGIDGPPPARAEWVKSLLAAEWERRQREMVEENSRASPAIEPHLETVFVLAALGMAIGAVALSAVALRRWRGGWRIAASLPLAALAVVAGRILVETARDPAAHAIWPFEILMAGGAGIAFVAIAHLVRKEAGAS